MKPENVKDLINGREYICVRTVINEMNLLNESLLWRSEMKWAMFLFFIFVFVLGNSVAINVATNSIELI